MDSLYHIRICSDETLQSHRQNTRNTTLFIAPLADVMHCQVLGGQRCGGSYIVQGSLALAGGAGVPGGGRTHQCGSVHGGGAPAASFYFCLRPVPEATVGCRPPTPTDVRSPCQCCTKYQFFPAFQFRETMW